MRSITARVSLARFAIAALAWSLALLTIARLSWVDTSLVQTLIEIQKAIAHWYGATRSTAVIVDRSCSGADVIALGLGVMLAYPAAWPRRLAGAAGGLAFILILNTARIGTLLTVEPASTAFTVLHLYVWPAVLVAGTAGYVLLWMCIEDGERFLWHRLTIVSMTLLALHAMLAPWTMKSSAVLQVGTWTAAAAATLLMRLGIATQASGNILTVHGGTFAITPECLLSPVIPLYLAAAATLPNRRRLRIAALVAAPLLFFALGVIRTLLVALPPTLVSSSLMSVHGFYQILVGGAVIAMTAIAVDRVSRTPGAVRVGAACGSAVFVSVALGSIWTATIVTLAKLTTALAPHSLTTLSGPGDVQGTLAVLPAYQLGLLVGLWIAIRQRVRSGRFATALIVLGIAQLATLAALGEARFHSGLDVHAVITRGWAVALPMLLALVFVATPRGEARLDRASYRDFWRRVGREFPDLAGARSTELYFQNEVSLLSAHIPMIEGCRLLKTDLWDEAKNTRILQWAARRGAIVHGIDLSAPIVMQARAAFDGLALKASHADVRHLPFTDNSFDVIYSMGTVEHFAESDAAVRECARVLKPGGRLILGVPNRHDPFLRPLLVAVLYRLGLYDYGFEKSYSRAQLRRMMKASGLEVVAESGILFIPGWLRMLDLACHVRRSPFAGAVRSAVSIFVWLDRRAPGLRRYGYLLASVGIKA